MLNSRQLKAYMDTCDIYAVTRVNNTDAIGTPGNETPAKVASGIKYRHQSTTNFPNITIAGRVVEANILTTDKGHFDVAQPVPDNGYLVNTTVGSPLKGRVYRILSTDESHPVAGSRKANKAIFPLRLVEHPPQGVG